MAEETPALESLLALRPRGRATRNAHHRVLPAADTHADLMLRMNPKRQKAQRSVVGLGPLDSMTLGAVGVVPTYSALPKSLYLMVR